MAKSDTKKTTKKAVEASSPAAAAAAVAAAPSAPSAAPVRLAAAPKNPLETYISRYIEAQLLRILSGEELPGLIGSVTGLKVAGAVLKLASEAAERFDVEGFIKSNSEKIMLALDGKTLDPDDAENWADLAF